MLEFYYIIFLFIYLFLLFCFMVNTLAVNSFVSLLLFFPVVLSVESIIVNILSVFSLVGRSSLLEAHVLLCCVIACLINYKKVRFPSLFHMQSIYLKLTPIFPLLFVAFVTASIFPPNTYDSLTYHMARIAHWIQNGSIDYYQTIIERQNSMGPGAELLILLLQLIFGSDILANFVQFAAYLFIPPSLYFLLRALHTPRSWIPWIIVLFVAPPMAVMQISGTKNDIVASLLGLSVLIAGRYLWAGTLSRMRIVDYAVFGLTIGSAVLVKPTSLLAAGPVLVCGMMSQVGKLVSGYKATPPRRLIVGISVFAICLLAITAPDIIRKRQHPFPRFELYPFFQGYDQERLWNPVKAVSHHFPFPEALRDVVKAVGYTGELRTSNYANLHEDIIGNPPQMLAWLTLIALTLLGIPLFIVRPTLFRAWAISIAPLVSWIIFAFVVRDQLWLSRLQLPLFFIMPFSVVFMGRVVGSNGKTVRQISSLFAVLGVLALAYAVCVAANVPTRPLHLINFWGRRPDRIQAYYTVAPGIRAEHDQLLKYAREQQCGRIGLVLGPDTAEYPLTWRAMLDGRQTRHLRTYVVDNGTVRFEHVQENLAWPCLIYAAEGVPEHVPQRGTQWLDSGDHHTFLRNLGYDFDRSSRQLLRMTDVREMSRPVTSPGLTVTFSDAGMEMDARDGDPFVILPGIVKEGLGSDAVILRVVLASPAPSRLAVYYQAKGTRGYDEKRKYTRSIRAGDNTLYLFLPAEHLAGPLRLDPGEIAGSYVLRDLEIRQILPEDETMR